MTRCCGWAWIAVSLSVLAAGCKPGPETPSAEASDREADPSIPAAPSSQGVATGESRGALLAELETLYRYGRYEEGLARARRGLERSIDDAALHFHRGLFLYATGDLDGAKAAQEMALELDPRHHPSHRALGDLARLQGASTDARDHFERCIAGMPDHAGCRFGLALSLIDLGELDAAAEPLATAAAKLDRAGVWSELGQLERRRRRVVEALDAFSRALALDRAHLSTLLGMGQTLIANRRRQEGQALLERHREQAALEDELEAVRRAADQPGAAVEVQLQLAGLHRRREDLDAAEATLREAVRRAPDFPPALLALANHLHHHGDPDEADALVDALPAAMADDPAVLFLRGTLDLARGDVEAATAHFDASRLRGPWPPPVYLDAGKAWSRAGVPARAAAAFERAAAGMPASAEAHLGLAESRRALGRARQALASVQRALELDPDAGRAWLVLGVLKAELGEPGEARRALTRGLEARRLDLLPAGGADEIRREVAALAPPPAALEVFDRALAALQSPSQSQK